MTNTLKNRTLHCFNKAWKTYDDHCTIQKIVSRQTAEILAKYVSQTNIIADFACGTGISTQHIIDAIGYQKLYAVDFSEKLLAVAAKKLSRDSIKFILSDFDILLFSKNYLNIIFCNMGLQWSPNLKNTLKIFNDYLDQYAGLLIFSIPLYGTFPELKEGYKNSYYRIEDINCFLKQTGFEIVHCYQQAYTEKFMTPFDAIRSLKNVGANGSIIEINPLKKISSKQAIAAAFIPAEKITLTYRIGIFLAKKVIIKP